MSSNNRGLAIEELVVDYEATIKDVYASLVKAIVLGTQYLNILCACQRSSHFTRSWVPDWTEPWSRVSLLANSTNIAPDYLRKCSFRASAGRGPGIEFAHGLRSIRIVGTRHSEVSVLGTWPRGLLNSSWVTEWFEKIDIRSRNEVSKLYEKDYLDELDPFVLSVCATSAEEDGLHIAEAVAAEYFLPYAGASPDWKEMVRIYHEMNADDGQKDDFGIDVRIAQMLDGRKVFIGNNGYCGLVPDHAEIGDLICVLFGCDVPLVLRRKDGHYTFIGECYVRGLMYGEAIEAMKREDLKEERFEIF